MASARVVSPADPDVHALLEEYFSMRTDSFPGGGYTTTFPDPAAFVAPAGVFLAIDEDGVAVGCGGVRRIPDGEAGIRYEVKNVFVSPTGRGRGWGRLLLDALEDEARRLGATELVLDTHHSLTAAAGLYDSSGFVTIPPYNDNPNATRWYGKRL
ncbi:MAG: GNAT family N-acetyltransferase [Microbacterium ginsengisoli]|jgi:ribosomal protein S18 acetylase RimI-like enzyme|uniref:GNAT family N-acetyltransferase n=1 Tax=Microbacterium TaxID=33882 RepID=UPI00092BF40C|nr:GNAT family N-acetyltransferase [Microbacterium sp. 71-23]MBN9198944.1 GNAT family N-acetyltransferase [Microbacterium ginsengisoli]OJU76165.1 MAG: PadR family transcriptional regulator [Microbacterium sp. 71-23]